MALDQTRTCREYRRKGKKNGAAARYLAGVVGKAHGRQLHTKTSHPGFLS